MKSSAAFFLLFLSGMIGCTPAEPPQPTAKLAGKVTLDGQPLEQGQVIFMPQQAGQARPEPAEIVQGAYEAEHVPQGKVKVMFSATRETGKVIEIPNSDESYPEVIDLIPARYASGIDLEVTADNLQQDFELTTP